MNLVVLSACYERPELSAILRESCEIASLPLHFCTYSGSPNVWPGSMRTGKMVAALEAIPALKAEGFTHVAWLDAFDTFVLPDANAEWIERRWRQIGCPPMVFSGEKNCWPDPEKAEYYPTRLDSSPWKYINAGTWLAQIDYLRDTITTILEYFPSEEDDQRMWTDALLGFRWHDAYIRPLLPGAIVDTERLIFQTMWNTELSEVGSPCVVHYNGGIWRNPEDLRYQQHWDKVQGGTMSGASMDAMFQIRDRVGKLPPWLRLMLLSSLGKYCRKCGRLGKKQAHGYGITSFSCEGGSIKTTLHHAREEWEAEL